jgi:hypothetical protein
LLNIKKTQVISAKILPKGKLSKNLSKKIGFLHSNVCEKEEILEEKTV